MGAHLRMVDRRLLSKNWNDRRTKKIVTALKKGANGSQVTLTFEIRREINVAITERKPEIKANQSHDNAQLKKIPDRLNCAQKPKELYRATALCRDQQSENPRQIGFVVCRVKFSFHFSLF